MFSISIVSTIIYGLGFCVLYYGLVCIIKRQLIPLHPRKLLFYVTLFSLFGLAGEVFVNNAWAYVFGDPLWEYRLFPAHGGDVSYYFPLVWGALGFYKYINDIVFHRFAHSQHFLPGIIMGAEAIAIELLYNGTFLLLFGEYIFYYFPANLGPLSHLSCLQVIPFYFMVGFVVNELLVGQEKAGYRNRVLMRVSFYWMAIGALILF